ncbi:MULTISPECIES: hypothetical protein [unclassified Leifsonia]|uniref:hypothetical protein n=1 Tax=unclassified Leifsonia TaxID=2663824 RepID=UPI0012F9B54C|nr:MULTISPECIES: hypothetical protein [unclassified Leifsonia]
MNVFDLLWSMASVGFIGLIFGLSVIGNRMSLESRAASLQRTDPGRASALLQAQAVSDHAYGLGNWLPEVMVVCTPSRRAALAHDDEAERPVPPPVPALPMYVAAEPHLATGRVRTVQATTRRPVDTRRTTPRPESCER